MAYKVHQIIRMKTEKYTRFWKVVGVHLGALDQESTYALKPLDKYENEEIQVPVNMMDNHPSVEAV